MANPDEQDGFIAPKNTPSDWSTPGFLAENNVAPVAADKPEEDFDPDEFLASSVRATPKADIRPVPPPARMPIKPAEFDPDSYLGSLTPVGTQEKKEEFNPDDYLKNTRLPADQVERSYDQPGTFSKAQASANTPPIEKINTAVPLPPREGKAQGVLGGPASMVESFNRSVFGGVGSAVQFAGSLLSQFDPTVDQLDDSTNPYIRAGLNLRGYANQNYVTDPEKKNWNTAGGVLGNVLPVTGTLGLGGPASVAARIPQAVGAAEFGGQSYTGVADQGVTPDKALAVGAVGSALGVGLPAVRGFSAAPAVASATWSQLAKNYAYTAGVNSLRTFAEMSGINLAASETSNAVLPEGSQQSQSDIFYNAAADALPMVLLGAATHGIEQGVAEHNVAKVAEQQGMSKADFILSTAKTMDAIANDPAKTPQEKLQAVSGFMNQFSPDAQQVLAAHVQNVASTIDKMKAAVKQSDELAAKGNPETAEALKVQTQQAAIIQMQERAKTIEEEADAAEKAAQEALAPKEEESAAEPEAVPEVKIEPQVEKAPETKAEEPPAPKQESPVPEGMASDEYDALAKKMEHSPDPDIQARARQLLIQRQLALQEHAQATSEPHKVSLEKEIRDYEEALRNLADQPEIPAPHVVEPIKAQPEPSQPLAYDEYGNPISSPTTHVETPPEEKAPEPVQEPAPTAEEKPVAENAPAEPERAPAAEGSAGVAAEPEKPAYVAREPLPASLKKSDLQRIALDEGHAPAEIRGAKTVKDLREMIERKRAVDAASSEHTPDDQLVKSGKAQVDPKIASLPKQYQEPVNAFVKAAKGWGLRKLTKFVISTHPQTASFWVDPASKIFDTVYINPIAAAEDLAYLKSQNATPEDINHYFETVFTEEFVHSQAGYVLFKKWEGAGSPGEFKDFYAKNFRAVHDKMSPKEREQTTKDYGSGLTHPVSIGEEYFRKTVQQALGRDATEAVIAKVRQKLKTNRPLRTLFQSVVSRFKGVSEKLIELGHPDVKLDLITKKLEQALGGKEIKGETEGKPVPAASPQLEPEEPDFDFFGGEEGIETTKTYQPTKTPQEMEALKPFEEPGVQAPEVQGSEKLRSERAVPSTKAEEKEHTIVNRISGLAHIDVPEADQIRIRDMAAKLAPDKIFNESQRDVAEGNAYVKTMIEAKRWIEKNGSLDGFGASRILKNALTDDARRLARGESLEPLTDEEVALKTEEGEEPEVKPKGVDLSDQEYESQQGQFEPVGQQAFEGVNPETPAHRAQNAMVEKNLQAITNKLSPYGRRMLEIWADTKEDPTSAFPAWANRAAKEFGVPRAKILKDFDTIVSGLRNEVNARGMTPEDFQRMPAAPKLRDETAERLKAIRELAASSDPEDRIKGAQMADDLSRQASKGARQVADFAKTFSQPPASPEVRQESFARRVSEDPTVAEDIRKVLASQIYARKANQLSNAAGEQFLKTNPPLLACDILTERMFNGRLGPEDVYAAMKLMRTLRFSPNEEERRQGARLGTNLSTVGRMFGQVIQAFRGWSYIGADGALAEYRNIIRPVIEKAKEPFKATTDAVENVINGGKEAAVDETIDRLEKSGLSAKAEAAAKEAQDQDKPIWQRYMERTAAALSNVADGVKSPVIRGALEEFSQRLQQNLEQLLKEQMGKTTAPAKKVPMSALGRIEEIYHNEPEYREAWEFAKSYIDAKYADHPDILGQYHDALNQSLRIPKKLLDKALDELMTSSGVKFKDIVKEWAGKGERTKQNLVDLLKQKMKLSAEQAKPLGEAIAARFNERLQASRKAEVAKLLKNSGNNRIANDAPALAKKIFDAVNLGATADEATWNAIADKLKLPKYDKAVADKLAQQAAEIQRKIGDGPGSFVTDHMTQDMMNTLDNEAQKHMSWLKQIGNGEMAVFYGNIFGPSTVGRKTISEVLNLVSEVGTMAAVEMRHGDALAIPRAYIAALRGLYQRGGADFRSIMATGRGMRQLESDYSADNLVERGKIFGTVPGLKALNKPLSTIYKPVGRALYGAQAFFYAGSSEARATMLANRVARELIKSGKAPAETSVNELTQQILGNSPDLRASYTKQAADEGLTGRAAILRAQELAEQQRPQEIQEAAHDFAMRATFMQEPEGVLGVMYRAISSGTRQIPPLRLLVPVTRVVSNVFNNFLSYVPLPIVGGIGLPKFGSFDGSGAIKLAQEGKHDQAFQQVAKMTAGAMSTIAMATLFGSNIQGGGPASYEKRKQLLDQGWIPYSIKIGDKYYSYREWPTALMMAGLGSYFDVDKYNEGGHQDKDQRLAIALAMTGRFALTSSWLSSVNNAFSILDFNNFESMQRSMLNLGATTTGALVPFNQSTFKMVDKVFDPESYPAKDIPGMLMAQVAFARRFNHPDQPALNALGDPIQVNPIQAFYGATNPDLVWLGLADKNIFVPTVTKAEKVNARPITEDEYYTLVRDAGQATKTQLLSGGLDRMAAMSTDQAQDYLSKIYHANVTKAKAQLTVEAYQSGETPQKSPRRGRR